MGGHEDFDDWVQHERGRPRGSGSGGPGSGGAYGDGPGGAYGPGGAFGHGPDGAYGNGGAYRDGPGDEAPGPQRSGRMIAGVAVAVLVVVLLAAGVVYALLGREDANAPTAQAPASGAATSSSQSGAAQSAPASSAQAGQAAATGCDPNAIAGDVGRPLSQVRVHECAGDWAYLYSSDGPGDSGYFAHRQNGTWTEYTSIPSSRCKDTARADGVPEKWITGAFLGSCQSASPSSRRDDPEAPSIPDDLGLSTPMTIPSCDGHGIVILYSAVTPEQYRQQVADALAAHPGAKYLRTDHSCPSLRQRDDAGNVIYAVYRLSGTSKSQLCADVAAAGGGGVAAAGAGLPYGRWLDTTHSPTEIVDCS